MPSTVSRGCRLRPGFTGPVSSTAFWSTRPPRMSAVRQWARNRNPGSWELQFEAMLAAARESANPNGLALVAMLGLRAGRRF